MKNLLTSIISLIIGVGVGSGVTYYFTSKPSTTETIFPDEQIKTSKGNDNYEIRWYGKPKNQFLTGNYTIIKPGLPIEFITISKSPHIVKIQLPKQSAVSASGYVGDIKIFKNGKECGKTDVVGDGVPLNKSCRPEL